jgi:dihydrodipicolinate synthase/N-acetylneuraminate lyase
MARAGIAAAEAGGADGVLLLPPYLVSGPPSGLVDHVRYAVNDTGVPVVVYHRLNGAFTPSSAATLLDIRSVVGLKDGVGDAELMTRIVTTIRASDSPRAGAFLVLQRFADRGGVRAGVLRDRRCPLLLGGALFRPGDRDPLPRRPRCGG